MANSRLQVTPRLLADKQAFILHLLSGDRNDTMTSDVSFCDHSQTKTSRFLCLYIFEGLYIFLKINIDMPVDIKIGIT